MSALNTTLLDVLKFKGNDGREIINEVIKNNPAFTGNDTMGHSIPVAFDTISKDKFKGKYRIGNPDIDPFRIINRGFGTSQGAYEDREFSVATAGQFYRVDQALVKRDAEAGAKYLTARCIDQVEATVNAMERQFFYGGQKQNGKSSKNGFQGLQMLVDPNMVHDAKGQGAKLASMYLVYFNNRNGVTWIFGENGTMEFSEPKEILVDDPERDPNGDIRQIPVIQAHFEFYPGVAYLSRYAAGRIVNIDVSTAFETKKNREALTDEMIATAIAKWPYGAPNAIITTKAAGMMLAASRTVTTLLGANNGGDVTVQSGYAVLPSEHNGIPIAYTDALVNEEKRVVIST